MEFYNYFDIPNVELFYHICSITLIPILILDVLITISMTYAFVSRLFMMMRSQINNVDDLNLRLIALNQWLGYNTVNNRLMILEVKAAVLSITSLLSSFLWVAGDAVAVFIGIFPQQIGEKVKNLPRGKTKICCYFLRFPRDFFSAFFPKDRYS